MCTVSAAQLSLHLLEAARSPGGIIIVAGFDIVNLEIPELAEPSRSPTFEKGRAASRGARRRLPASLVATEVSPTAFPLVHCLTMLENTRYQQLAG